MLVNQQSTDDYPIRMLAGGWLCTCLTELTARMNAAIYDCRVCRARWTAEQLFTRDFRFVPMPPIDPRFLEVQDRLERRIAELTGIRVAAVLGMPPPRPNDGFLRDAHGEIVGTTEIMTSAEAKQRYPELACKIDAALAKARRPQPPPT